MISFLFYKNKNCTHLFAHSKRDKVPFSIHKLHSVKHVLFLYNVYYFLFWIYWPTPEGRRVRRAKRTKRVRWSAVSPAPEAIELDFWFSSVRYRSGRWPSSSSSSSSRHNSAIFIYKQHRSVIITVVPQRRSMTLHANTYCDCLILIWKRYGCVV